MPTEMFVCNGFASDVFAVLTPSLVDADSYFSNGRHLWTGIPVGNVVPVQLSSKDSVEPFSVNDMVPVETSPQDCPEFGASTQPEAAYVSVYYVNLEGVTLKLQDNHVAQEDSAYIISLSGDIHLSSKDDHWVDLSGVSHKPMLCEECNRCRSIESSLAACSSCFYVTNISTLQSAMRCVLDVGVSDMLIKLANNLYIEPATKGFEQTKEIKEKLKEKAKKYALIESEARRFVAMTREYGERVQEAFEEYEEEENFDDFAAAAENTSGLQRKFEQVTNQHAELINEVDVLKNEADEGRREMNDRANNMSDRGILQNNPSITSTTLGSGLLAAAGVVGRTGAIGLAVTGSATLIGLLGYGGYKLFRKLTKEAQTNFAYLAQSFDELSRGIEDVSRHLGLIEDSLRNIESKWRKIIDEDGKLDGVRRSASIISSTSNDQMLVDGAPSGSSGDAPNVSSGDAPSGSSGDAPSVSSTNAPSDSAAELKKTRKEKRLAKNIVKKVKELMEACEGYERRTSGSNLSLTWR